MILALSVVLANELLLKFMGHNVPASVTTLERHAGHSGFRKYLAQYTYDTPSTTRSDQSYITWNEYLRLSERFRTTFGRPDVIHFPSTAPAAIPVRVYDIGLWSFSRAVENEGGFVPLLLSALFVPLLLFFFSALYLAIIIRPRRTRHHYTNGIAVPGVLTGRRLIPTRYLNTYSIEYTYTPEGHQPLVTSTYMDKRHYEANPPKEIVTILYDPANPKRSTIYHLGGYYCHEIS
jgi:hypothetical protein